VVPPVVWPARLLPALWLASLVVSAQAHIALTEAFLWGQLGFHKNVTARLEFLTRPLRKRAAFALPRQRFPRDSVI
jgi:hypothetical protein